MDETFIKKLNQSHLKKIQDTDIMTKYFLITDGFYVHLHQFA